MPRIFINWLLIILFFIIPQWGISGNQVNESNYFTLKKIQGKWWFIKPDSKPLFSIGLNVVAFEDNYAKLGAKHYDAIKKSKKESAWAKETYNLLTNIGFNTMGCWSSPEIYKLNMPYTLLVEDVKSGVNKLVDIFDPNFEKIIEKAVLSLWAPHKDDPNLLGYFVGNDLFWYGDYPYYMGHNSYLFDIYFDLQASSAGKKRIIEFLRDKYKNIDNLNSSWNTSLNNFEDIAQSKLYQFTIKDINSIRNEFLTIVAERYYSVLTEKIRTIDKNHLIFSDRYANSVPETVLKTGGKYCDAVSINYYRNLPDIDRPFLAALSYIADKPLIISEFTFRSMDNTSGLLNRVGPDTTVSNQQDRADHFEKYAKAFSELPFVIGYHWFQFFDEPQDGRSTDGEDSNYGIVDLDGRPYIPLINAMRELNPKIEALHKNSTVSIPPNESRLTYKIKVREGKRNTAFDKYFLNPENIMSSIVNSWGDTGNGARADIQKNKNALVIQYNTGNGWGCGISLFPPDYQKIGYYDASGFKGIKIKMSLPAKLKFFLYMNESGVDQAWKKNYPGANGADGESYSADESFGNGKIIYYNYNFEDFNIRPIYGNQTGNKTIDLQAINDMEIALPGNQGAGTITINSIEFY